MAARCVQCGSRVKACSSHGMSPIFYDLLSSAKRHVIARISKRNENFTKEVNLKQNETKTKHFCVERKQNFQVFSFDSLLLNRSKYRNFLIEACVLRSLVKKLSALFSTLAQFRKNKSCIYFIAY